MKIRSVAVFAAPSLAGFVLGAAAAVAAPSSVSNEAELRVAVDATSTDSSIMVERGSPMTGAPRGPMFGVLWAVPISLLIWAVTLRVVL